jgi:AcrR family transcriptional regulator
MPRRAAPVKNSQAVPRQEAAGKPRQRDAEVLEAAADIFYERGYASATIQDVADSLGMLKGSLYYYIDTKEDLLYRLMEEIHDGVDKFLAELQAEEERPAAEQLERYVKRAIEFNARNLTRISVYYHDIDQLSDARRNKILSRRRIHEEYVTKLIRQAQADGDAAPDLDAKLLNNCVFATIIWMYRWYRPNRGFSVVELSETCARFVRYGLGATPSPRASRAR